MIDYNKIRRVRIELSTRCNSICPDCPRNLRGVEILDDVSFPVTQLYLDDIKKILPSDFINQLNIVSIDGNFGDFVTARDALEIVQYIKSCKETIKIEVSTNASARPDIWEPLGSLGQSVSVSFRLDGLRDTHHLYRQNTDWDLILENAGKFIKAGGHAVWAMIEFDHNQHQVDACRQLSRDLGFHEFFLIEQTVNGRVNFPVFRNKNRELSHVVGNYSGSLDFEETLSAHMYSRDHPENELKYVTNRKKIQCRTMTIESEFLGQEIYISADGNVFPCCWTGFYPAYKSARYSNKQLLPLMEENNAREYGIRHAIGWFEKIVRSWDIPTVQQGRILICNQTCGHDE